MTPETYEEEPPVFTFTSLTQLMPARGLGAQSCVQGRGHAARAGKPSRLDLDQPAPPHQPLELGPHPFPMPWLAAHPQRLAHLAGTQRTTRIGHHLDHVPVGHRQPAPIAIPTEGRNLGRYRCWLGGTVAILTTGLPTRQHLGDGLLGDRKASQQLRLGGQLPGQPIDLSPQPLHPSARGLLPRRHPLYQRLHYLLPYTPIGDDPRPPLSNHQRPSSDSPCNGTAPFSLRSCVLDRCLAAAVEWLSAGFGRDTPGQGTREVL